LRELHEVLPAERPRAGDFVDAQADIVAFDFVEAELVERLTHVEIGFAGGDDADLRIATARGDDLVELVGAHESEHGVALVIVQTRLLAEERILQPDVEAAFRHDEVGRRDDLDTVYAGIDHAGRLHRLVHAFERGPSAGIARHRPAVERVVDDLLHAGGIQNRDHHVDEMKFGLVRGGRGFRGVVVAHQRQHAAVLGRAGEIGVAEHVAAAVDAGALAVPQAEDAVVFALAAQLGLLRAPQCGGGEVFVQSGLELDVGGRELPPGAHELLVEGAERGTAIAGDVARGVQARALVALALHQRRAHQRLEAGHQDMVLGQVIFVVEADGSERHAKPLATRGALRSGLAPLI